MTPDIAWQVTALISVSAGAALGLTLRRALTFLERRRDR